MLAMKTCVGLTLLALVAGKPSNHCVGEDDENVHYKAKTCPDPGTLIDDIKGGDEMGLYEGDIWFPPGESKENRNMAKVERYKWQKAADGKVYIPYDDSLLNDKVRNAFLAGVQNFEEVSCIRFIKRTDEVEYVELTGKLTCYSGVGRREKGKQRLNLSDYCARFHGIVLHEMLHVLGFMHEHARADRDDHITIHWQNVCDGCERNFEKASQNFDTFGTAYDYHSVLHYDEWAGTKNGEKTIVPKADVNVGQRLGFSTKDIEKVNLLYRCQDGPATALPTTASVTTPEATTASTQLTTTTESLPSTTAEPSTETTTATKAATTTTTKAPTTTTAEATTTQSVITTEPPTTTIANCANTKSDRYCEYWLGQAGSMDTFCNDRQWTLTANHCAKTCGRC